jgi:hypothetical protein
VNNDVHTFVVEVQDTTQVTEIHVELHRLSGLMHDGGVHALNEIHFA